jgi:hypothetical protein
MLRFMPVYMRVMIQRPMMMFAPTLHADIDALDCGNKWRGRRSRSSLVPEVYNDDPLDELVEVEVDVEPKREPASPKKRQSPGKESPSKKQTLPTPSDVPPPTPTDVPAPEPWGIPPPDPKDPRPKSIP